MTELVFRQGFNSTLDYWKIYEKPKGIPRPPKKKHLISEEADGAYGKWVISPSTTAQIKFAPALPDGMDDYTAVRQERNRLESVKEFAQDHRRIAYLNSIFHSREHGYAESMEEARLLINAIERGSDGLPDYREALMAAGFVLQPRTHQWSTTPAKYESWEKTIKSGTFNLIIHDADFEDAKHGHIHCMYSGHGVNHWHNVFRLDADCRGQGDPNYRCYVFWPESAKDDLRGIAVSHLLDVIDKRLARGKTRLSTPLGGAIPRNW